jgi:hypothetical protein
MRHGRPRAKTVANSARDLVALLPSGHFMLVTVAGAAAHEFIEHC